MECFMARWDSSLLPWPFSVVSCVNQVDLISLPEHSGDCGVHPFRIEHTPVEDHSFESESFVPCAGHMAGPPFHEWPGRTAPFVGSFRFTLVCSFREWGFSHDCNGAVKGVVNV